MTKTRRLGLAALFALLLVGGFPACSQSDKAGILLTVNTDATVPNPQTITSLQVTVGTTTRTYDVSGGILTPGTLGIKTSPGGKQVVVSGFAGNTLVAKGDAACPADAGKVLACTVVLTRVSGDAGTVPDASPTGTGGAPGFDGNPGNDVPASTGGSGGTDGAVVSGGTTSTGGTTSAGGATGTGGLSSTGGSSPTGGVPDAGGGAPGPDARSGTDAPAAGGAGGTGGVPPSGGTTRTGGVTSTGGTIRTGGLSNTGGISVTGGTTSTGGATKLVATAVAAAWDHTCAVIKDGTIWCWGNNSDGELGNQDPKIDGSAIIYETKPVQVKGVTQAISIATGDYHTCAALASGTVQCWGYNEYGQLGNGASGYNTRSITPTAVIGMPAGVGAVAVVAGSSHTCALLSDKTVKCWGDNYYDQLGSGSSTLTSSMVPVTVVTNASTLSPLTNVTTLALTTDHACAIQSGGALYCWGDNIWGQLGTGTTNSTTVAVRAGTIQAVAVGAGDGHTCVVGSPTAGSPFNVQCWGRDSYGELGDNGTGGESHTPVNARVSANASTIALGANHSCAVLVNSNVTVQCWGSNTYGQLGNGNTGDSPVPVDVLSLTQAKLLSGGEGDTCAVVSSGAVYCWGSNKYGQLGDGNGGLGAKSAVPVLVSGF
jgi:alpha-tubulin suppressor-like RCC1 family protein